MDHVFSYFIHRHSFIYNLPIETSTESKVHSTMHPFIHSSIHLPINPSSYLRLGNGGRMLSPVFQTSSTTRNIFQVFLGDPEAFPYQMGCIIPTSSSGSTPRSPPNWKWLEDFQGEVSESDAWTSFWRKGAAAPIWNPTRCPCSCLWGLNPSPSSDCILGQAIIMQPCVELNDF